MAKKSQKIYAGTQLREIRMRQKLTQNEFASRLSVSVSYLNQMENNHRPIASAVMLNLFHEFDFDVQSLNTGNQLRLIADMREIFAELDIVDAPPDADLQLIANNAPILARAILDLHRAYRSQSERLMSMGQVLGAEYDQPNPQPWEEVRDFFHYCDNYIDALDRAAEKFAHEHFNHEHFGQGIAVRELEKWFKLRGISVVYHNHSALRFYDAKQRILYLSQSVEASTRIFQLAVQMAYESFDDLLEMTLDLANFHTKEANAIAKIGLANYFAGAFLMPYSQFLQSAMEKRHDLEALSQEYGTSIEQVAHRLSTLQRQGQKGIPFFFVRVDQAGTITKRHSATHLQFARFGGACPLWNVHRAFETPRDYLRQFAQTPDGVRYFCLAKDVSKTGGNFKAPVRRYAIGLGCEIQHIDHIVYADDLGARKSAEFEAIGSACRICPRSDCYQRSVPPFNQSLTVNHDRREIVPYKVEAK